MDWITEAHEFALVALAGLLGGVIGLEREIAGKPAGFRTHILVAAGAALLMLLGAAVVVEFQEHHDSYQAVKADPIRVIQAIIVGISFLGAGTIIHEEGREVEGLTTAASVFLTAAIGIAVTVERIALAVAVTLATVLILLIVGVIERLIRKYLRPHDRLPQ